MKRILLLIFSATALYSCQDKEEGYEIFGIVKNIPDSTIVVMSVNNSIRDSAMVMDEQFRFTGNVEEPVRVSFEIEETGDRSYLWLENSDITFTAEQGNFEERVITGSNVQEDDDLLEEKIKPFQDSANSLRNSLAYDNLTETAWDTLTPMFDELRNKEREAMKEFVRIHPNSVVSSYILNFYKTTWDKETTADLYSLLSPERRESKDGKMIGRFLDLNADPKIGEPYVDFEMKNAEGKVIRLSEIKGTYTLLYFWSSDCSFSIEENPRLVQNYNDYRDQGFEVVGVSIDDNKEDFLSSIREHDLMWHNLMAPAGRDNDAALIYGVSATPQNYLIDEQGTIIGRNLLGTKLTTKLQVLFRKDPLASAEMEEQ